jgi:hypothetical protein
VVGVISWKFAEPGAESLSFTVPITNACEELFSCQVSLDVRIKAIRVSVADSGWRS